MGDQKKQRGRKKVPHLVKTDRIRALIDRERSRQVIADSFGCDVSTITKHYNGDNPVDLEMLYKYARYFNVSTDYLLGLSNTPTTDKDKAFVCEYTGLSEMNVTHLAEANSLGDKHIEYNLISFLNLIIETFVNNPEADVVLTDLQEQYYLYVINMIKLKTFLEERDQNSSKYGLFKFHLDDSVEFVSLGSDKKSFDKLFKAQLLNDTCFPFNNYEKLCTELECVNYETFDIDKEFSLFKIYNECRESEASVYGCLYKLSRIFNDIFEDYSRNSYTHLSPSELATLQKDTARIFKQKGVIDMDKLDLEMKEERNAENQNQTS